MKNKTPLYFGAAFLVLVVIFFATSMNPRENTAGAYRLFANERPDVDKIEFVSASGDSTIIERQSGVWNIVKPLQHKASENAVQQALNMLINTLVDGVVSTLPESHSKYEVDEASGTKFKIYSSGKVLLDVFIGKNSIDFNHTYTRLAGSNDVTIWRNMFSSHVRRGVNEWRDKMIFTYNPDDVMEIRSESAGIQKTLARADSVWVYTENGTEMPVVQQNVNDFSGLIASLRCDAFADEKDIPRAINGKPDTKVTFRVRNGDEQSFEIWSPGENDAGRYLVRTEEGGEIFRFYRYRGEMLGINYEKLQASAPQG